ncbi:hypothetical protein [Azohydromonas aeria]|uniref:hypothetical protein n=1 Tax=Azohydromonas aeria TaxID=2590212 RepID=UPI0012F79AB5|nr:hypothetical protein [Azohydromonas aeria]
MSKNTSSPLHALELPSGYLAAMADIEQRAFRGELSLAQLRHEIFTVRERFDVDACRAAQWAALGYQVRH